MATDPKVSEGARLERKALRSYLRRELRALETREPGFKSESKIAFSQVLDWVLSRQKRYGRAKGGLGKGPVASRLKAAP